MNSISSDTFDAILIDGQCEYEIIFEIPPYTTLGVYCINLGIITHICSGDLPLSTYLSLTSQPIGHIEISFTPDRKLFKRTLDKP